MAPGKSFSLNHIHIHDVHPYSSSSFNLSHVVRHLSFGERINFANTHPLDGMEVSSSESEYSDIFFNFQKRKKIHSQKDTKSVSERVFLFLIYLYLNHFSKGKTYICVTACNI